MPAVESRIASAGIDPHFMPGAPGPQAMETAPSVTVEALIQPTPGEAILHKLAGENAGGEALKTITPTTEITANTADIAAREMHLDAEHGPGKCSCHSLVKAEEADSLSALLDKTHEAHDGEHGPGKCSCHSTVSSEDADSLSALLDRPHEGHGEHGPGKCSCHTEVSYEDADALSSLLDTPKEPSHAEMLKSAANNDGIRGHQESVPSPAAKVEAQKSLRAVAEPAHEHNHPHIEVGAKSATLAERNTATLSERQPTELAEQLRVTDEMQRQLTITENSAVADTSSFESANADPGNVSLPSATELAETSQANTSGEFNYPAIDTQLVEALEGADISAISEPTGSSETSPVSGEQQLDELVLVTDPAATTSFFENLAISSKENAEVSAETDAVHYIREELAILLPEAAEPAAVQPLAETVATLLLQTEAKAIERLTIARQLLGELNSIAAVGPGWEMSEKDMQLFTSYVVALGKSLGIDTAYLLKLLEVDNGQTTLSQQAWEILSALQKLMREEYRQEFSSRFNLTSDDAASQNGQDTTISSLGAAALAMLRSASGKAQATSTGAVA